MQDGPYESNELDAVIERFEPSEILERVAARVDDLLRDRVKFKDEELTRMRYYLKAINDRIADKSVRRHI